MVLETGSSSMAGVNCVGRCTCICIQSQSDLVTQLLTALLLCHVAQVLESISIPVNMDDREALIRAATT